MSLLNNWIFLASFAAITFGLGDFIVVLSGEKNMDIFNLYMAYNIIVGLVSLVFLYLVKRDSFNKIKNFSGFEWLIVLSFSILYYSAYMSHFIALQKAPNPGYSNALIMFHVVILTLLSVVFLNKPLNWLTTLGIGISFVGAYMVILYSGID